MQGAVNPDEFYVHKPMLAKGKPAILRRALGSKRRRWSSARSRRPEVDAHASTCRKRSATAFSLTDAEVLELARYAVAIEKHYGRPMDIEWGRDGSDGKLYILQARPETVKSRKRDVEERYALKGSAQRPGRRAAPSARRSAAAPCAWSRTLREMARVRNGDVLVTDMTDPNWEPVMKRAAAIVTNRGGRTCHAAIIARELGIPAVVGCGDATQRAEGRAGGHRLLRRGRHRQRLRRHAAVRGVEPRARRDAARSRSRSR